MSRSTRKQTLSDGVKWDWKMHTANTVTTIKLPWTMLGAENRLQSLV